MHMRPTAIALLIFAFSVATGSIIRADHNKPSPAPLQPETEREMLPGRGFVPPRMDLSHLTGKQAPVNYKLTALPARWDWREQSAVTEIKNQGSCGSCYAFAALANFESKLLIDGEAAFDFSENNAKECNWYQSSCGGGNYTEMASWFSQTGTVDEADDPYVAAEDACDTGNPYIKTLLDWRIISEGSIPDTAVLKQYIYDYGPVYTSVYAGSGVYPAWESEFNSYNGSYTLHFNNPCETNHAVLIIGWDDNLVHDGGTGGWIVKNSWGTGWGGTCDYGTEGGYFYIAYSSANIGYYSSYIYDWQDYDTDGDLLYYDEGGFNWSWGYSPSTTAWGMCKFVQPATAYVTRVEFWTNDATTDIDIYVYDDFDGFVLNNLLESKLNVTFNEAGYHSVALDSPPEVTTGDDFFVAVKFTNAAYDFPVCTDADGPNETATTFMSSNGSGWLDMGTYDADDVAIRARTSTVLPVSVTEEPAPVPTSFRLSTNYPNPFNPSTTICYSLETRSEVEVSIFNVLGRKVRTLVEREQEAGEYSVTWDGRDQSGQMASSGVYLYRIKAGKFVDSKKMMLLK